MPRHRGNDAVTGTWKRGMILVISLWTVVGKGGLIVQNKGAFIEFVNFQFREVDLISWYCFSGVMIALSAASHRTQRGW
jgi:hypothetical protein